MKGFEIRHVLYYSYNWQGKKRCDQRAFLHTVVKSGQVDASYLDNQVSMGFQGSQAFNITGRTVETIANHC